MKQDKQGSNDLINKMKTNIESFINIEFCYNRESTKKYLESRLNLQKTYDFYFQISGKNREKNQ